MSKIAVTCSDCETTFNVRAELAGKRVKCPTCSKPVRVIAAEDEDEEPTPAPVKKKAGKSKAKGTSSQKSLMSRILTTAVLTLLVIGGLGLRAWSRFNRIQERNAARRENDSGQMRRSLDTRVIDFSSGRLDKRITVFLTVPTGWIKSSERRASRDKPSASVSVEISRGKPSREVAENIRSIEDWTVLEAIPVKLERYSAEQHLLGLKSSNTAAPQPTGIRYLIDLPEGSVVLTFRSRRPLTDADTAEFHRIANSMDIRKG